MFASAPGIPLDEAVRAMKPPVTLPPESSVGTVTKAVQGPTTADGEGNLGLRVLYASGIELVIMHREADFAQTTSEHHLVPFEDGRTHTGDLQYVSRRQLFVVKSGVQTGGQDSLAGSHKVPASVSWHMDGYNYHLFAATDSLSIDDLMMVAESMF